MMTLTALKFRSDELRRVGWARTICVKVKLNIGLLKKIDSCVRGHHITSLWTPPLGEELNWEN